MCDDYVKGDTVGIRITKPDRTNTSRKILTCKVLEKKDHRYRLYSPSGILGTTFSHTDLLDFRNMRYEDIETVEPSGLEKVAFTKAARECSGFKAKKDSSVCQCKGKCNSNKCSCKKNNLACSTKCHPESKNCINKS